VERAAALDPALATFAGIAGHDRELPDLSADGFAGRAELDRSTLAALDAAEASGPREQTVRAAMQERLAVAVERHDAGDLTSDLNVTESCLQPQGLPLPGAQPRRHGPGPVADGPVPRPGRAWSPGLIS
jgi:uncharacterized protein DUF885